jgi:hypothetical protein
MMGKATKSIGALLGQRRDLVLFVSALLLAALTLSPTLGGSFYGDDAWGSLYGPRLFELRNISVFQHAWETQAAWISSGRFFPLSGYSSFLFYAIDGNVLAYRLFLMALSLANVALLGVLVAKMTRSRAFALLAMLLVPLAFQLRFADDPLTTYTGLLQVVTCLTLLSLIALVAYIDTGRKRYLVASLAAYGAGLLTYEVVLPFFVMHLVICWLYPRRLTMRELIAVAWPFVALVGVAVIGTIALRMSVGAAIAGGAGAGAYALNWDPVAIAGTFVKQTTAAFPLSYYAAQGLSLRFGWSWLPPGRPLAGFAGTFAASPMAAFAIAVGFAGLVGAALLQAVSERPKPPGAKAAKKGASAPQVLMAPVAALGLCLLLLPGTLIALSPKYQAERWVRWGVGYLPVYVSYFGVALLLAAGLYALAVSRLGDTAKKTLVVTIAIAAAFVGVIDYGNSAVVIQGWAPYYDWPRALERAALERGVMDRAPEGGAVLVGGRDFEEPALFLTYGGKRVGPVVPTRAAGPLKDVAASSSQTSAGTLYTFGPGHELSSITVQADPGGTGRVVFGSAQTVEVDGNGAVVGGALAPSDVYLSWDPATVADQGSSGAPSSLLESSGITAADWDLSESGPGWALYRWRGTAPGGP